MDPGSSLIGGIVGVVAGVIMMIIICCRPYCCKQNQTVAEPDGTSVPPTTPADPACPDGQGYYPTDVPPPGGYAPSAYVANPQSGDQDPYKVQV
jgi:hypothetical protein